MNERDNCIRKTEKLKSMLNRDAEGIKSALGGDLLEGYLDNINSEIAVLDEIKGQLSGLK